MTKKYYRLIFTIIIGITGIPCIYGQSIMGDDYKKELWKTIKPQEPSRPIQSSTSLKQAQPLPLLENNYIKTYLNRKFNLDHLLEVTEPRYKISPGLLIYRGSTPLNQLPDYATRLVYMGGHFYHIPIGGSLVFPSGTDLSGGGRKKLSSTSKNILINVLGMEIDE